MAGNEKPLKWFFELLDKISGPAAKMSKSLGGVSKSLTDAGKMAASTAGKFELFGVKAKDILKGSLTVAFGNLISQGITKAGQAITWMKDKITELGREMILAVAESQRLAHTFKTLLGEEGAARVGKFLDRIALKTEFGKGDLERATGSLLSAGFKGEELKALIAAGIDVANLLGGGAGALDQAIGALSNIKLTGRLDNRALKALRLSPDDVFGKLGELLGKTAEQAEALATEGKTPVDAALNAVFLAIENKQQALLGSGGVSAGKTIAARITQLRSIPGLLFGAVAEGKSAEKLNDVMTRIVEKLDPNGKVGKNIISILDKMLDAMVTKLDKLTSGKNWDNIEKGIAAIARLVTDLGPKLLGFVVHLPEAIESVSTIANTLMVGIRIFLSFGDALGTLAAVIYLAVTGFLGGVMRIHTAVTDFLARLIEAFVNAGKGFFSVCFEAGSMVWRGLVAGISSGVSFVVDGVKNLGSSLVSGIKGVLDIKSPSGVFEDIGKNTALGFSAGFEEGSRDIEAQMMGVDRYGQNIGRAGSAGQGARTSVGGVSITVPITVQGGPQVAEDIGQKMTELLPSLIVTAFERMGAQQGAEAT